MLLIPTACAEPAADQLNAGNADTTPAIVLTGEFKESGSCTILLDGIAMAGEGHANLHIAEAPAEAPEAPRFGLLSCEIRPDGDSEESAKGYQPAYATFVLPTPDGQVPTDRLEIVAPLSFTLSVPNRISGQVMLPQNRTPSWDAITGNLTITAFANGIPNGTFEATYTPQTRERSEEEATAEEM